MKIYIVHTDLLAKSDKPFYKMTDEEVVQLCEQDEDMEQHDVYESVEELSVNWNTEEIFYPNMSYVRVVKEPEYVWVFTADQVADDDVFDVITEVFATEEAAKEHLHEFVYGDEGELEYAKKRGWTVEYNEPDHYRAFEEGYYSGNHTEATIEKREVKR